MTDCFLSLHGGSGVDESIIVQAIDLGINKASIYTRISNLAVQKLKNLIANDSPDLSVLLNEVRNGYREMIQNRLKTFRIINICAFQSNVCQLSLGAAYSEKSKKDSPDRKPTQKYDEIVAEVTRAVITKLESFKEMT